MAFFRAYESDVGPNPFQYGQSLRGVPNVMPRQPMGGIAGLFDRLRASGRFQPQYPGGGRGFPGMQRGFPGGGGGFFGGFRPRLRRRRRPPPQMPDYSSQFSSLEAKIKELQDQLAARQTATPLPDPVANLPEPRVGTLGGTGVGEYPLGTAGPRNIPQIDPIALQELQDRIAGASATAVPPMSVPPNIDLPQLGMEEALPRRGGMLPRGDSGGRKMIKPPSIERIMPPMQQVPDVMPPMPQVDQGLLESFNINPASQNFGLTATFDPDTGEYVTDLGGMGFQGAQRFKRQTPDEFAAQLAPKPKPMPMPEPLTIAKPMPMPSLPKFPMPQIDPMGRVAAPLTRGPVNTAINMPMVGMRGPGARMR